MLDRLLSTLDYRPSHAAKRLRSKSKMSIGFIAPITNSPQFRIFCSAAWMTRPENTARWSLGSGYIPVKPAAFDVPEYKAYTDEWPQALTAYRQLLEVRVERNLMTHNVNAINKLVNSTLEAILDGRDVETALKEAQEEADKILKDLN
jgi:hypothetical protein